MCRGGHMKVFINDMIHMSEGEKFINYWWLWLVVASLVVGLTVFNNVKKR